MLGSKHRQKFVCFPHLNLENLIFYSRLIKYCLLHSFYRGILACIYVNIGFKA